jgi:hypothetical protein
VKDPDELEMNPGFARDDIVEVAGLEKLGVILKCDKTYATVEVGGNGTVMQVSYHNLELKYRFGVCE